MTSKAVTGPLEFLDNRLGIGRLSKKGLRKVFPDHWSFLLGEVAMFSLFVVLLTGVFLTFWFKPSMQEVVYDGTYVPMVGVHMSEAFASTLDISFDVRGGLLMRQIHHWGALIFIAAIFAHMLRNFFTGAFRKPRELNWIIGSLLLQLALLAGFSGYSLPDDLLSGTGLRFAEGLIRSIPVIGTYLSFWVFGGEFPGDAIIPRMYPVHVLLIPALILALFVLHLALVIYNKHTQFAGAGKTNRNVVGPPFFPVYMAKAGGFFFIVFGFIGLMAATMQINPVWNYGPYNPSQVGAGTQPDWYMGWLEGGLRIMPNWETVIFGYRISWNILIPGVGLMGLLAGILILYPFVERWITGDNREHHILDRPRNVPTRTGFGVAAITAFGMMWIGGGNDIIATQFSIPINYVTWALQVGVILGPIIAFIITRRICISLQRKDREEVLHGRESGVLMQTPTGEFYEAHESLSPEQAYALTAQDRPPLISLDPEIDEHGVPERGGVIRKLRGRLSRFYFGSEVQKPTRREVDAAHNGHSDHDGRGELESGHGDGPDEPAELGHR